MGLVLDKKLYACKKHYEEKRCFVTGLATHCVYTLWVLMDKLHEVAIHCICDTTHYNSITIQSK